MVGQDTSATELRSAGEAGLREAGMEEIIALSGISLRFWRLYAAFWLVCLFFPIYSLVGARLAAVSLLVALAGLALFTAVYLWEVWPYPLIGRAGLRSSPLPPAGLTLLALFLSLAYGSAFAWLFLGASAILGLVLPPRRAFWGVMALTLLTLGVWVIASGGLTATDWLQVIPLVLLVRGVGVDMAGFSRLAATLRELNVARRELARRAVVEERLRVARDLHDLLGHTLSLITLKSELARRLVEKNPQRSAQEVLEIERTARVALREVREAIAGYRKQSLASELEGARQILEAAGILCRIEQATGALPAGTDLALAWTVREGVTNVIRHSRAKQCLIRIASQDGMVRAEVINDGLCGPDGEARGTGSGLSGLAERINAQGGQISAAPFPFEGRPGFRLMAELPIQNTLAGKESKR